MLDSRIKCLGFDPCLAHGYRIVGKGTSHIYVRRNPGGHGGAVVRPLPSTSEIRARIPA